MIYYQGYSVSFQEVPDEVSLVILIADCPYHCPGCHSPELQEPKGKSLECDLDKIIDEYADAITCVCFMGEGQDPRVLNQCARIAKSRGFKTALYTGNDRKQAMEYAPLFDYIKYGAYISQLGGLNSKTTNQHMFKIEHIGRALVISDITKRFQEDKI